MLGKESRLLCITSIIQYICLRGKSRKVLEGTPVAKERKRISKRLQQQLVCVWWTDANWIAQWRNGSSQFFF